MAWDELPDQFKALGPAGLQALMISGGLPANYIRVASEWIASKHHESERLREASQSEQIEIARSAKDAAWEAARAANSANTRATVALTIAAVSAITTIIGIVIAMTKHSG